MGRNKALLLLDERPLILRAIDQARLLTDEIWISANDTSTCQFLEFPVVPDLYPGQGPLAGLHAVMLRTTRSLLLVLACDLPSLREPLLMRLVQYAEGYDAVIPRSSDGGLHPLCAVYRRSCLAAIEQNLSQGTNKVTDIFLNESLRVKWLTGAEGHFRDEELYNLNSPQDLERYRLLQS